MIIYDLVRPDSVPVDQDYMSTDVCDRFSPGVRDGASLDWQIVLDSHGVEPWECMLVSGDSPVACLSDWRSVLQLFAPMPGSPEFPDTGEPDFCLRILISQVDLVDVGRNDNMDFKVSTMCSQAWMPVIDLWMFAQTLPALPFRQEWLVRKEITGAEGSSGASPEGIARLRG